MLYKTIIKLAAYEVLAGGAGVGFGYFFNQINTDYIHNYYRDDFIYNNIGKGEFADCKWKQVPKVHKSDSTLMLDCSDSNITMKFVAEAEDYAKPFEDSANETYLPYFILGATFLTMGTTAAILSIPLRNIGTVPTNVLASPLENIVIDNNPKKAEMTDITSQVEEKKEEPDKVEISVKPSSFYEVQPGYNVQKIFSPKAEKNVNGELPTQSDQSNLNTPLLQRM